MSRTAHLNGISTTTRVPSPEPWTIGQYSMRGVDGLVVPGMYYAAQAARVLDDIRYCVPTDFERNSVIVQVESTNAVNEVDGFLDVDDIDCYFIGVVDLSKNMGYQGDYGAPQVVDAIEASIERVLARGDTVGITVKELDFARWTNKRVTEPYSHLNDFALMGAAQWHQMTGAATPTNGK